MSRSVRDMLFCQPRLRRQRPPRAAALEEDERRGALQPMRRVGLRLTLRRPDDREPMQRRDAVGRDMRRVGGTQRHDRYQQRERGRAGVRREKDRDGDEGADLGIGGANLITGELLARSVPDTWVTVYSGDMGNTLGRMLSLPAAAKPLARYGAMGARFASGFAVWRMVEPGSGCRTLGPNGLSRGSSLQVSWSKYPRS